VRIFHMVKLTNVTCNLSNITKGKYKCCLQLKLAAKKLVENPLFASNETMVPNYKIWKLKGYAWFYPNA